MLGSYLDRNKVDEIEYFVPMPFHEEFCTTYVGGVAPTLQYPFLRSHTMVKNVKKCSTNVFF
jgi:hypothetical protein